jgi:integrase
VPPRHRGIVATAAGAGLRWGEAAGLRTDALDLDGARLSVIRTVVEVGGHTWFKPFPNLIHWPTESNAPIFANEVGLPLRRTLFRSRIWRPALVRAGMLGGVCEIAGGFRAEWTDANGDKHAERLATHAAAVNHVARNQAGGLRFHDLRHSYATWRVDDGVPPDMVQAEP